ncbi:arylsulfatase-like isoform X1 [Lingula anatina]|uniref:Arylsulfatase-like isoform X1 n=2 Tax=Lingula anatina TaxID=7574 RepID=A0A2R2MSB4_LINAN|nr:arylsulfatase-like isoform X1 [Lingula anatina]|eukprot:XP_023933155.1 arylsulfatase-like isoform X1 [Lingula anatina]
MSCSKELQQSNIMTCCHVVVIFFLMISRSLASPNILLFVADDMGYGDLSIYGHPTQEMGPIDQLALQGLKFTSWYAAHTFCSPSRAAMLTGRLPVRYNFVGGYTVLIHKHYLGLPLEEYTIAEALRDQGYATGIVGKWHLGVNAHTDTDGSFLPHNQGFSHPATILPYTLFYDCDTTGVHRHQQNRNRCMIYRNSTIVQQPIKQGKLTATLVEDAKAFLYDHKDEPFFFLFSFPQVHTPMFNDVRFNKSSKRGEYGDQINEMSWAVGEVMATLSTLALDEKTLVIFLSDHGPHREICKEGGSSGIFKGGKGNFYEGGVRVPAIMRWTGVIPPGRVSSQVVSSMDLLPSLVSLVGGQLPNVHLDGENMLDKIFGKLELTDVNSGHFHKKDHDALKRDRALFFYCDNHLMAIRYKSFKVHFRTHPLASEEFILKNCPVAGVPIDTELHVEHYCNKTIQQEVPLLFNVEEDPGEMFALDWEDYQDISNEIQDILRKHQETLPEDLDGHGITSFDNTDMFVLPCCNKPYCICDFTSEPPCPAS